MTTCIWTYRIDIQHNIELKSHLSMICPANHDAAAAVVGGAIHRKQFYGYISMQLSRNFNRIVALCRDVLPFSRLSTRASAWLNCAWMSLLSSSGRHQHVTGWRHLCPLCRSDLVLFYCVHRYTTRKVFNIRLKWKHHDDVWLRQSSSSFKISFNLNCSRCPTREKSWGLASVKILKNKQCTFLKSLIQNQIFDVWKTSLATFVQVKWNFKKVVTVYPS